MAGLQTEFSFTLPKGFIDDVGMLHRHGVMRLATARDEIEPLRSREIDGPDDPYLTVLVLARVVKELGSLAVITPDTVANLFAADLAFLQDLYGIINFGDPADVAALQATVAMPEPDPVVSAWPDDVAVPISGVSGWVDDHDDADDDGLASGAALPEDVPDTSRPSSPRTRARIEEVQRASAP